jgi:hypothetical protein
MDTTGRTALTLKAINIVDEFRDRELIVTYELVHGGMGYRYTRYQHKGKEKVINTRV